MVEKSNAWVEVLSKVKPRINAQSFRTWLRPTRFDRIESGVLYAFAPTAEFAATIKERWSGEIRSALQELSNSNGHSIVLTDFDFTLPAPADHAGDLPPTQSPATAGLPLPEPSFDECPKMPEAAWHGEAKRYRELVGGSCEASDNFHLACFLAIAGAGLAKSVYFAMPKPIYPNPFVVLVGQSAWAGKGTAMGLAMDLANECIPDLIHVTSVDSAEGTTRFIVESVQQSESKRHSTVLIQLDEYNALLAKSQIKGSKIIPDLKRAFDSPPVLQLTSGLSRVHLQNPPMIALIAGSETDDLADMSPRDVRGGLGNRQWYIPGEPKAPNPDAPAPNEIAWLEFAETLKRTFAFWREKAGGKTWLEWSPDAHTRWQRFYSDIRTRGADNFVVGKLSARDRVHMPKVALIYAALARAERIELEHAEAAIAFCDFLLQARYFVFRGLGLKPWVKDAMEIVDYVRHKGGKVLQRQLQRRFDHLGPEGFERQMRFLVADERNPERHLIRVTEIGDTGRKSAWIRINSGD